MKFMSGVLALAGLAAAAPEADPAFLTAATPYLASPYALPYAAAVPAPYYAPTYVHAPSPVGVKTVSSPVASVSSVSGPLAVPKAISPIRSSVTGAPLLQPFGALSSRDCVTEGGCLVATLKGAGLAKREAEAEPQLLAAAAAPFGLNPYYAGVYASGLASPYYAAGALPYTVARAAPAVTYVNEAPVAVAAPAAVAPAVTYVNEAPVAVAAPAPVAPAVTYVQKAPVAVAAPAPVAVAAPAPVTYVKETPVVVAAPVRPAVEVPVVEKYTRPVTYTHLGAHPIQPTTVLETDSRVVGRKFI